MADTTMLNRLQAAKFLKVSTRTIDRYVASEKFSVIRENGKVLFEKEELENFKSEKNPIVGQVVSSPSVKNTIDEEGKYKILYKEAKDDVEKRDDLIRNMHYRLGTLEEQNKTMVPMLEAETERIEMEEVVEKISMENVKLTGELKRAKYGRIFFFFLSFIFLIALAIFWASENNIFDQVQDVPIIL